jgi:hypothetical protein
MKRSLTNLLPALVAAATVVLVAGAAPAQALDSCSAVTPCLPQGQALLDVLPNDTTAVFVGNTTIGVLHGANSSNSTGSSSQSGVSGNYQGNGRGSGVYGTTSSSTADNTAGVFGLMQVTNAGTNSAGVRGEASSLSVASVGVLGLHGSSGIGVKGQSPSGVGVLGVHTFPSGTSAGVQGATSSNADFAPGVLGVATGNSSLTLGVLGASTAGIGVLGSGPTAGVVGYNPAGVAGLFVGDVNVTGTLTKGAGAFRIDHPLDPAHKYLQHSFVESPDMKNVYDGVVTTDRHGFGTVRLPSYFQALNRSFRYQLTTVGAKSWGATVGVWRELRGNRFTIRSSRPNVKVSWQVTGIRKDRYANAHRIQPEIRKPAGEQGTYLSPELYGRPRSESAFKAPSPSVVK